jgi:diguanylate cyclase (GGDEF)-like protein
LVVPVGLAWASGSLRLMRDDQLRDAAKLADSVDPARNGADPDRRAEDRDARADARDRASDARDERADARDERAEARDQASNGLGSGAAADRVAALRDRRLAARDRARAADDRRAASGDRFRWARERAASSIDGLTGALHREAGIVALERDIARARRTDTPFTLVFVDVIGLKDTNDSLGHAAGDRLLRATSDSIRTRLRAYDLIVRFGGDEFVCGLLDMSLAEAAERFSLVSADLAGTQHAALTVGVAELGAGDGLGDLIARADDAMYKARQQQRSARA